MKAVKDEFPEKYVVIAAYSDYERMHSISPFDMAPLAAECGADFAMVDTGIKDRQEHVRIHERGHASRVYRGKQKLGIGTALAGALKFEDIEALKTDQPGYHRCPGNGLRRRPECTDP